MPHDPAFQLFLTAPPEDYLNERSYGVGSSTLTLRFGDLTMSQADVLVSSDDAYLTMGGGVSAAIRRAAGQQVLVDAAKLIPAALGDVVLTSAGSLAAKYIFHAITIGSGELSAPEVISCTTRRSLELVRVLGLKSIAFPAIGTGAAGFSYEDAAVQMAEVIVDCLKDGQNPVHVTIFLHDRFERMQPLDFIAFFEEFAARTRGLKQTPGHAGDASITHAAEAHRMGDPATELTDRERLLNQFADLERERQKLEAQLAEYGSMLERPEVEKIEKRLGELGGLRVGVLSEVVPKPREPVSVFVSYAHADERLRKDLGKHLSVLERQGLIATWHDRKIGAGHEWEGEIDEQLERSRVILLLISSDFVHSRYCYDVEMKRALERHAAKEALVIPVILRPVSLEGTPFAKLQALPKDAKPVIKWSVPDSAFVEITEGLRTAVQNLPARV